MNNNHLETICTRFDLGTPINTPQRVYGGLLHTMWRINTNKASYAVKQLSPNIALTNERIVKNYELSERIASRFIYHGIPAISALEKHGKHLVIIDGTGFLVYPWVDAKALDSNAISESHAIKIATTLAEIHSINLDEPNIAAPEFYTYTKETIFSLIAKAVKFNCPFANALLKNQDALLSANEAYKNAIPVLKTHTVISHGDLDQKNVLWDSNNQQILIDWESACKVNPTYDIINTAFYWSGITTGFNKALFFAMIDAYQKAGGIINTTDVTAVLYGTFSWIGWLVYNIERSCIHGESEQKTLGIQQVNQTMNTILRLQTIIPGLQADFKTYWKITMQHNEIHITQALVEKLIQQQFPQWTHLPITPVAVSGWDNRTFHLGETMTIRLPSAECYAAKVEIEQMWLPFLAHNLSVTIPQPVAMGKPSDDYPWNWSVYRWIEGKSANLLADNELNLPLIAQGLAQFLRELHAIDTTDVPLAAGPHNFYRGGSLTVYDAETRNALTQLQGVIDTDSATVIWNKAISSQWNKKPVWIHGDISAGNILIDNGLLTAVIDFGGMGVGDPACDLVIAWTFFYDESRTVFRSLVELDSPTWARARGWALWKALITLAPLEDKMGVEALRQKRIINELIQEQEYQAA